VSLIKFFKIYLFGQKICITFAVSKILEMDIGNNWNTIKNSGNIRNKKTGRLLKIQLSNSGYYICRLCKNGRCKTVTINSLKCKDTQSKV
jgi:hypothetical protein